MLALRVGEEKVPMGLNKDDEATDYRGQAFPITARPLFLRPPHERRIGL